MESEVISQLKTFLEGILNDGIDLEASYRHSAASFTSRERKTIVVTRSIYEDHGSQIDNLIRTLNSPDTTSEIQRKYNELDDGQSMTINYKESRVFIS
ncbi:hypothetical protein J3369_21960 [Alteromonas sp. NFXS44]|uniref:hypothetical protein n=1 Tax=Alteromonas sp. NFXS44 TaxID=2818435 RepID=UPI0032DFB63E